MEPTIVKQPYEKPDFQEIDINIESPLLVTSGAPPVPGGKNIPIN